MAAFLLTGTGSAAHFSRLRATASRANTSIHDKHAEHFYLVVGSLRRP